VRHNTIVRFAGTAFSLFGLIGMSLAPAAVSAGDPNLLANSGFESGLAGWSPYSFDLAFNGSIQSTWGVASSGIQGRQSAFLNVPVFDDVRLRQLVTPAPHRLYVLSGTIATTNVVSEPAALAVWGASLRLENVTTNLLGNDFLHTRALLGTNEPTKVSLTFCSGNAGQVDASLGGFAGDVQEPAVGAKTFVHRAFPGTASEVRLLVRVVNAPKSSTVSPPADTADNPSPGWLPHGRPTLFDTGGSLLHETVLHSTGGRSGLW
jgi:hypothetical protein